MKGTGIVAGIIVLCATSIVSFPQRTTSSGCLHYEPTVVRLTGAIVRKTFPGPPNYESVREGDRAETYWLLKLQRPVSVCVDVADPEINTAKQDIREIQLVLKPEYYKQYRALVGKRVVATGTLFGEITGHHHTPVLLTLNTLSKVETKKSQPPPQPL